MVLSEKDNQLIESIKSKVPNSDDANRDINFSRVDINQMIEICEKLKAEVTQLGNTRNDLTSDKTALETQVSTLTSSKTALETQVSTLTGDKTTLETQVSTLTNDKTNLETQVSTLTGDKTNLETQVSTLTEDKTKLEQQLASCEQTNKAEIDRLTALNQQYVSNENDPVEIVNLKKNINSISKEMTSIMEQITNDNKQNFLNTYFQSTKRDSGNNPIMTPKTTNIDIGNDKTAPISDLIFANQGQLLPSNVEVNINSQGEGNTTNNVSAKITFTKQNIAYVENLTTSVTNTLETTKAYDHIA